KLGDFTTAHTLSDQDIVTGLAHIHTTETQLAASRLAMLTEADRRGLALQLGHSTIKRWYAKAVRLPEGNIAHQMTLGKWLTHNPTVAEALTDGTIHYLHTKAIADATATVLAADPTLTTQRQNEITAVLLDVATRALPKDVHDRGQELAHHAANDARARHETERQRHEEHQRNEEKQRRKAADSRENPSPGHPAPDPTPDPAPAPPAPPPGPPPLPVAENTALNRLGIYPLANGRSKIDGDLDKLTVEKLKAALSPLTAPTPSPDGTRDPRTPDRRNADGLSELLDRYLHAQTGTGSGAVNVNLTIPLADLLKKPADAEHPHRHTATRRNTPPGPSDGDWPFWLDWTGPISGHLAQYLSCDAHLTPVIVDHHGVPLALGRSFRLASTSLRQAVIIRDRCCVMCGRPAQWCQIHHVTYWNDGGATDLNNLA
ncbi:HNH endonuclease, partial [Rhodococcoides yunnanense]|uniref:HNH endonuclease n=1 Tax=Rhodococcoides yunnanense TaxID=278209 RepID=UPI0022B19768